MKELTKKQKQNAEKVCKLIKELANEGVIAFVCDGGGGRGIEFWRPTEEEDHNAYELMSKRHLNDELEDCIFTPTTDARIDYIIP